MKTISLYKPTKEEKAQDLTDWKLCHYAFEKRRAIEQQLYDIKLNLTLLTMEAEGAKEYELLAALKTLTNWKG